MSRASYTPELLLEKAGGKIGHLMGALVTSSVNGAYKLLNPEQYGFPSGVFDVRSDLPGKLAKICGCTPASVRSYYIEKWKKYAKENGIKEDI